MDKKLIFNEHGERGTQSMIGGNTTNLREWNRIKYDWANQMYRTMLNNFWIPEEISLNEDVKQFPYLTDYERRAFDKIIAFLNFLDSIQSENLPNLSRYITASEVASLLNIQTFQEEIHAQSYSYILDTVTTLLHVTKSMTNGVQIKHCLLVTASSLMHTNVSATILAKQTLFIQSLLTIS